MSAPGPLERLRPRFLRFPALVAIVASIASPSRAADRPAGGEVQLDQVDERRALQGDSRFGSLSVKLNLAGARADFNGPARAVVKAARDDRGTSLLGEETRPTSFSDRNPNSNQGQIDVGLGLPARGARSVSLSGAVELLDLSRDPSAVVTVKNALATRDRPLSSPGLKAAKVEITLLSKERYQKETKKLSDDPARVAEIRAEAKKRGISDAEVEMGLELAKALDDSDGLPSDDWIILSGGVAEMEKIYSVKLVDAAGEEVAVPFASSRSDGKRTTKILQPEKAPPKNASLVFTLVTSRALVKLPFDLKEVPLP